MSLVDVCGQGRAQGILQRALAGDRLSHAYLFHGPEGVGKEMLGRGLSQLLLCKKPTLRTLEEAEVARVGLTSLRTGCGRCTSCLAVVADNHPDLYTIYRQLNRKHPEPKIRKLMSFQISVDVIRYFLIERVAFKPQLGRAKVFLVREAHRMSPEAQNALLKTLEEPPGDTVLVLLVTALDQMLPTTLSRCQVIPFDALPNAFVEERLHAAMPQLSVEQARWHARVSQGSLGVAGENIEDDFFSLNQRLVEKLVTCRREDSDKMISFFMEEAKALGGRFRQRDRDMTDAEALRRGLAALLLLTANWFCDLVHHLCGETALLINANWHERLEQTAAPLTVQAVAKAIQRISQAESQLALNINTQLCMETLVYDLMALTEGKTKSIAGRTKTRKSETAPG